MKRKNTLIKICIVFLTIARFVMVIGLVMVLYFGIFENTERYFTVQISRENYENVQVDEGLIVKTEYENSIKGAELKSTIKNYVISFNTGYRIMILLALTAVMGFSVYFIHTLLQFVKSALGEGFFSIENVLRVRMMGFILIGLGLVDLLMNLWISYIAGQYFELDKSASKTIEVSFSPDVFSSTIFIGLIVLVVAQAFDHGLKLKEDKELTI